MKQYIRDNEGNLIEVTDLTAAIKQIAAFLTYRHEEASPLQQQHDLKPQKYYKDLYIKLCHLREQKPINYEKDQRR
jgi:hypothetical protein